MGGGGPSVCTIEDITSEAVLGFLQILPRVGLVASLSFPYFLVFLFHVCFSLNHMFNTV